MTPGELVTAQAQLVIPIIVSWHMGLFSQENPTVYEIFRMKGSNQKFPNLKFKKYQIKVNIYLTTALSIFDI